MAKERNLARKWLKHHASWHSFIEPGLGASIGAPDVMAKVGEHFLLIEFKHIQHLTKPFGGLSKNQLGWWRRYLNKTDWDGIVVWLGDAGEWQWIPVSELLEQKRIQFGYSPYAFCARLHGCEPLKGVLV